MVNYKCIFRLSATRNNTSTQIDWIHSRSSSSRSSSSSRAAAAAAAAAVVVVVVVVIVIIRVTVVRDICWFARIFILFHFTHGIICFNHIYFLNRPVCNPIGPCNRYLATRGWYTCTRIIGEMVCDNGYITIVQKTEHRFLEHLCPSVCLSVCPSVRLLHLLTMLLSSHHHEIFRIYYHWRKWRPCKRSEVKGQGHRGQNPS